METTNHLHGSLLGSEDNARSEVRIQGNDPAIRVIRVVWSDPVQTRDWLNMLDSYARDRMGGGRGLSPYARAHLVAHFGSLAHAFALLAYIEAEPVGIANCIESFSTFACARVINLHDFAVDPGWRGRGIGRMLMDAVEAEARQIGCCKLTLEVLEGNLPALALYRKVGFCRYQFDENTGGALFMEKPL
jgi:ribosomal protein S18 acetylase RimI-like enzyme